MHGYYQRPAREPSPIANVIRDGKVIGEVNIRTAATPQFDRIVLATRGNLAALRDLHNFYEQHGATFPENKTETFEHGVVFDGRQFVYHRYDSLTGDVIFRPFVTAQVAPTAADVVEGGETILNATEGAPAVVAVEGTDPTGDTQVPAALLPTEDDDTVDLVVEEGETLPQTAETFPIGGDTPQVESTADARAVAEAGANGGSDF